jgi:hypothetical protein
MGPSLYVERSRAAKADLAATKAVTEEQAAPGDFTMGEEQLRHLLYGWAASPACSTTRIPMSAGAFTRNSGSTVYQRIGHRDQR